jgi:hypothetical protein
LARPREGGSELRAPVESIGSFASFDLGQLLDDNNAFSFGEACDGSALRLDTQA